MASKTYIPGAQEATLDPLYTKRQEMQGASSYGDKNEEGTNFNDAQALGYTKLVGARPAYNSEDPKLALEEEQLKKFHCAMFEAGREHREPRDAIWRECWALYNNEYDFSQKAWWQHKSPIPKVRTAVDRAAALFRKTLLKMNPFYGLKAESKIGRVKGRFTMLLDDHHFDQSKVVDQLVLGFKVGLITSTSISKIWWMRVRDFKPAVYTDINEVPTYEFGLETGSRQETKKRVELEAYDRGQLGFACINPSNLWVIPGTRGRSIIERSECTLNELEANVKNKDNPNGIYEEEAVEKLRQKIASPYSIDADVTNTYASGEGAVTSNNYLRKVILEHYWGDIYDDQGKLVMCDATYTFAGFSDGAEVLIRKARPNPFYHKLPPYVLGSPYLVPFSTYNRGMIEDVGEIAKSIVEMANLIADGALYDALKAFAIDADQLDDPAEAKGGMYPGKTFVRKSSNAGAPNEQLVQTINVGKIPAEANNMIGLFEKYFQEGTYINEFVGGFGNKTDRTLGEVNIKTQSALEGLDESARNLEVTFIEPSLSLATKVIYQFHEDYLMPRLMENYPQVSMLLQDLTPPERYATMVGDFSFEVKGLSIMIDRQQKIGEFKEILQLLSYLPGFLEQVNPNAALEEIFAPIGWDPNKLLLNPSAGAGITPMPGAMPSPSAVPPGRPAPAPGSGQGQPQRGPSGAPMTPMGRMNASQGARQGGAIMNPAAASQMQPQIMRRMIMDQLMKTMARRGVR